MAQVYKSIKFDIKKHINNRVTRYKRASIYSKDLPGLSTIELNISELCNRTCSFCPRYDPKIYPNQKKFMDISTIQSLVDQIQKTDWKGNVHLSGFGEPHSHPDLLGIVKTLKQSNKIYLEITTNGDRLVDKDVDELIKLFNNGLDVINVDCYDSKEQYTTRKEKLEKIGATYNIRNYIDLGVQKAVSDYGFTNRGGALGEVTSTRTCHLPLLQKYDRLERRNCIML